MHFFRALIRVVFLGLCIIPLGAGFLPVLFDERRRGCHDLVARTVVVVRARRTALRPGRPPRKAAPPGPGLS